MSDLVTIKADAMFRVKEAAVGVMLNVAAFGAATRAAADQVPDAPSAPPTTAPATTRAALDKFTPATESLDTNLLAASMQRARFATGYTSLQLAVDNLAARVDKGQAHFSPDQAKEYDKMIGTMAYLKGIFEYCLTTNPDKDPKFNPNLGEKSPMVLLGQQQATFAALNRAVGR